MNDSRKILLIGTARESSTRVPNKMTRPFGNSSLYRIYLEKFEEIAQMKNPFNDIIMSISKKDKNLWELSQNAGVRIVERNDASISPTATKPSEIYHFLNDFNEDYVMHVNGCFAFLKPETIIKIATFFKNNNNIKSLTCVKKRYNHFWNFETKKPINNLDKKCLSTQDMPPLLESVLFIMMYNRKYMLQNDCYWDFTQDNPYLYVVEDNIEGLDIDTEFEFKICETIYKNQVEGKKELPIIH